MGDDRPPDAVAVCIDRQRDWEAEDSRGKDEREGALSGDRTVEEPVEGIGKNKNRCCKSGDEQSEGGSSGTAEFEKEGSSGERGERRVSSGWGGVEFLMEFPIVSFGISLGIASQANLWGTLHSSFNEVPNEINWVFWCISILAFATIGGLYVLKMLYYPRIVQAEFGHPRRVNFFIAPTLTILTIMSATPEDARSKETIQALWIFCFLCVAVFSLFLYGEWLFGKNRGMQKIQMSFLMGTIGHFLVGVEAEYVDFADIGFFSFSVGVVFFFLVFIGLFQNLHRLPKTQRGDPVLFLFIAPPAAAALASSTLLYNGQFGEVSKFFYFLSLFLYMLLLRLVKYLLKAKFSVVWWAYTFPMSISAVAALHYYDDHSQTSYKVIALLLTSVATLSSLIVSFLTAISVWRGSFFVDPVVIKLLERSRHGEQIDLNCMDHLPHGEEIRRRSAPPAPPPSIAANVDTSSSTLS
eukprot:Nk52_evm28s279 gene=Nk52_evmTU28s279